MTAQRLPAPKEQFFDSDGNPLAGGLVYTYAAGTSTPLATFSEYAGTDDVENTNPIVLDAAGRANIWYSDALYKIVLQDSDGVEIYSVDDFPGSAAGSTGGNTGPFGPATDVDSNTLVDLGTITGNFANITGTVTINSFGSTATTNNPIYLVKFNNSLTVTNSSDILVRAGVMTIGDNLVTATGDYAWIEYLGSGTWKVFGYCRGDGSINATTISCGTLTVTTTANLP